MAKSGTLRVRIIGDAAPFQKTLSGLSSTIGGFAKAAARAGAVASAAMAAFGVSAVNAASNLEQSIGAVESVFGSAANKIFEFGDTAADQLGLSRREVNETAAVLGASLQSMGFSADETAEQVINLQGRAADMAATFGGSTREALEAIASLMRGERDPIERYGVAIKQADINARLAADGLEDLEGEAAKQAEAQAALSLLFDQTANSAGQFGREADTLAGKQARLTAKFENLRAEIGEKLLPVVVGLMDGLLNLVDKVRPVATAFFAGFTRDLHGTQRALFEGHQGAVEWGRKLRLVFDQVWGAIRRFVEEQVVPRFVRLKDAIAANGDRIGRIFNNIGRVIRSVAGIFGDQFRVMSQSANGEGATIEQVVDTVIGVIEGITDTVADVVEFFDRNWPKIAETIETVSDLLSGDLGNLSLTFERVFNEIVAFAASKMAQAANIIIGTVNNVLDRLASVDIPGIGRVGVNVPDISYVPTGGGSSSGGGYDHSGPGGRMHTGGVVSASMPRHPGLGMDERAAILQVGERVVPRNKAQGGATVIENHFHFDTFVGSEEKLARMVADRFRDWQRRGGGGSLAFGS